MTNMPRSRQPQGVPTGGQFAAEAKTEATGSLTGGVRPAPSWRRDLPAMEHQAQFATFMETGKTLAQMTVDDHATADLANGFRVEYRAGEMTSDPQELTGSYTLTNRFGRSEVFDYNTPWEFSEARDQIAHTVTLDAPLVPTLDTSAAAEPEVTEPEVDPFWGEVIHRYTRADAIRDGVLIEHSELAKDAGFNVPVALTVGAQSDAVTWTRDSGWQDETGRAWDVLNMARRAGAAATKDGRLREPGDRVDFQVLRVPNNSRARSPKLTTLSLVAAATDDGRPAFVIMKPDED